MGIDSRISTSTARVDAIKLNGKAQGANAGDVLSVGDFGVGAVLPQVSTLNTLTAPGVYDALNKPTGWPHGGTGGWVRVVAYISTAYIQQIALSQSGNASIRGSSDSGSTWGSWVRFWNENTDGPGSGLDADTLDGAERAAFAERNASVVFTDITGNKVISETTYPQVTLRASASNQAQSIRLQDETSRNQAEFVSQTNDEVKIVQFNPSTGSVVQDLTFRTNGTLEHGSNEIYDQGNLFTTINDVTASRAKGTTYTNNTGGPMQWIIEMNGTGSNAMTVAGVTVAVARVTNTPSVIVPNGATYSLATAGAGITRWIEIS